MLTKRRNVGKSIPNELVTHILIIWADYPSQKYIYKKSNCVSLKIRLNFVFWKLIFTKRRKVGNNFIIAIWSLICSSFLKFDFCKKRPNLVKTKKKSSASEFAIAEQTHSIPIMEIETKLLL